MGGWLADAVPARGIAPSPGAGGGPALGRHGRRGFSLAEVLVAVLVFEVGLLAGIGLLRLAAHEMAIARRAEAAQWAAAALADSLVAGAVGPSGEREDRWGLLRWAPDGSGVLVEGVRPERPGAEPLARIWIARSSPGEAP